MTDVGVHITSLADLEYLNISETRITDEGLESVATLQCLHTLDLSKTKITAAGIMHLELPKLRESYCNDTQISDLIPLANLKNLTALDVQGTSASQEQIKLLQQALPNCRIDSDF